MNISENNQIINYELAAKVKFTEVIQAYLKVPSAYIINTPYGDCLTDQAIILCVHSLFDRHIVDDRLGLFEFLNINKVCLPINLIEEGILEFINDFQ